MKVMNKICCGVSLQVNRTKKDLGTRLCVLSKRKASSVFSEHLWSVLIGLQIYST